MMRGLVRPNVNGLGHLPLPKKFWRLMMAQD
jgi:hypothetical protein